MSSNGAVCPRALRGLASCFTISAGTLMITAHQTKYINGSFLTVEFNDLAAYWCFIFANFVVSAYSLLLICLPSKSQLWRFAVALDFILTVILIASCSSALTIGMMESEGNPHAFWLPICHIFPFYCFRVFLAIGLSFFGSFIFMIVQLICIQEAFNIILLE
ncbi:unnamed protein product [Trifolium pratense]|uniref:Uncharacterized protein n=1 Tax=Trifolium pratense TaxID=57577 RepID=A0ACB0M497_TRIPR|nr:unnamed protein product [Trifolium pratense]